LSISAAIFVETFVKNQGEKMGPEEAEVFADLPAATGEQTARMPVVDGLLGDLQQFGGLIARQDRGKAISPGRVLEGSGQFSGG
jgi:hypothetical protein